MLSLRNQGRSFNGSSFFKHFSKICVEISLETLKTILRIRLENILP